jgi:hypothetical protein
MSESETDLNPYAATLHSTPAETLSTTQASFARTLLVWTLVCSISAVPSFFWGLMVTDKRWDGMLAGIVIFIGLYVVADYVTRETLLRRDRVIRRTLRIGYWTRLIISSVFPIGFYLDLFVGAIAIGTLNLNVGGSNLEHLSFVSTLLLTLTTGALLNVVVFAYMLLVFAAQHAYMAIFRQIQE